VTRAFLLDVNVLIALVREDHEAHLKVKQWFLKTGMRHWATCPLTEAGFVRVVVNPKFAEPSIDMSEALEVLEAMTQAKGHQFWAIDVGIVGAVQGVRERLFGHQQVTDAYLLGLAVRHKGVLVTLDRGLMSLAGSEFGDSIFQL
jgi:hypothetical protein